MRFRLRLGSEEGEYDFQVGKSYFTSSDDDQTEAQQMALKNTGGREVRGTEDLRSDFTKNVQLSMRESLIQGMNIPNPQSPEEQDRDGDFQEQSRHQTKSAHRREAEGARRQEEGGGREVEAVGAEGSERDSDAVDHSRGSQIGVVS